MLEADCDTIVIITGCLFLSYINISFYFSAYKNCNAGVTITNIQVISILAVNIQVTNYNAITIARNKPFLSYIKIGFHFFAYKNHNIKKAILAINIPATSGSTINMPAINILIVSIPVVSILATSLSIAKKFLLNLFLAISTFLIVKIVI